MVIIQVPAACHEKKLDRFLQDQFPSLPRNVIYKALRLKDIRVNGKRIGENITLFAGDELKVYIKDDLLYSASPAKSESLLQVVYEDKHLLLVNKQPGISVHPDKNPNEDTLIDIATRYLIQNGSYDPSNPNNPPPVLCHRLDHYTGGIVIIAKTRDARQVMLKEIKERNVKKFYQCIIKGCPDPMVGELKHFLIHNSYKSQVYITDVKSPESLTVITRYKVLESGDKLSRLEVELVTGRTHQIRAHLAYIGHPILGDDKYGDRAFNKEYGIKHQALWAYKVVFNLQNPGVLKYLQGKVFETKDIQFPIQHIQ